MSALGIYSEIMTLGWSGVSNWQTIEREETLHLEFKRQTDLASVYNDKDRGEIAKAMAGFANVEGGVVVFGVHAKDMGKRPDKVQSILPIANIEKMQAAIDRDVPNLTDPPIAGVRVERIVSTTSPDEGIVIIYVPPSDGGPHRVIRGSTELVDRYYMRTASQTVNMPHAIMAAMFGRRPQPKLRLHLLYTLAQNNNHGIILISNSGRGHAESIALRLDKANPSNGNRDCLTWSNFSSNPRWYVGSVNKIITDTKSVLVRSESGFILCPGMTSEIVWIRLEDLLQIDTDVIMLKGELYAKDSMPISFSKEILLRHHQGMSGYIEIL